MSEENVFSPDVFGVYNEGVTKVLGVGCRL